MKIDLKRINGPRMGKNKGERKLSPFSFGNVRSRLQTAGEREKKGNQETGLCPRCVRKPAVPLRTGKIKRRRNEENMIGILIALLSGALMSVQGVFNTGVTKNSGIWVANAFVQATAFLVCLVIWGFFERTPVTEVFKVEPKYMLLGGAIGAFITYTVIKSMDMLGPAKAVMLIVIAQLLVAYVIELLGLWGTEKQVFEIRKAVGMAVAIAGIVIFKWK